MFVCACMGACVCVRVCIDGCIYVIFVFVSICVMCMHSYIFPCGEVVHFCACHEGIAVISFFNTFPPVPIYMHKAWAKPKRRHLAQNFLRLVERMNNLTLWMATAILSQRDVNDRAKRIMLFAQIAHVRLFSVCMCACVHVCV